MARGSFTRRGFLQGSAGIAAAAMLPRLAKCAPLGANEQIRVATIGLNGRGGDHISSNHLGGNIVALCDCDERVLGRAADQLERRANRKIDRVTDFRRLLDRDDIHAISIATPNHWHSLMGILAAQAGKHVYVEKPVSHHVWEGRQLANAARKYNVVIQTGTQSRSSPSLHEAVEFVKSGKLGKIQYAIGTCYKPRPSIGKLDEPLKIPESVDYNLWCGPAAMVDLYRPKLHYDWHWDFNTGNGDMGNQGIHQMDIARWFTGHDTVSHRVISVGGRLGYDDAGNTPNTQTVLHDYPEAPIIFETRGLPKAKEYQEQGWGNNMDNYRGSQIGVIVQCEQGYVVIPSYTEATAYDADGNQIERWRGGGNHYENFLQAIREGDSSLLNADIVEGHLSSALCHTGGISHQLGEKRTAKEIRAEVSGNNLFADSVERMLEHLQANEVNVDEPVVTLGPELFMDPESEDFLRNPAASDLLRREDREEFQVPAVEV
jgi:predicted dehydrogenase